MDIIILFDENMKYRYVSEVYFCAQTYEHIHTYKYIYTYLKKPI